MLLLFGFALRNLCSAIQIKLTSPFLIEQLSVLIFVNTGDTLK